MSTTTSSRKPRTAAARKPSTPARALVSASSAQAATPVEVAQGMAPELAMLNGTIWTDWWRQMMVMGASQFAQQMNVLDGLVNQQWQAWKAWEQSAATLWRLPGLGVDSLHVSADSAGGVLCPSPEFSAENMRRTAFGWAQAMSEAWLNAMQHDLEDAATSR